MLEKSSTSEGDDVINGVAIECRREEQAASVSVGVVEEFEAVVAQDRARQYASSALFLSSQLAVPAR